MKLNTNNLNGEVSHQIIRIDDELGFLVEFCAEETVARRVWKTDVVDHLFEGRVRDRYVPVENRYRIRSRLCGNVRSVVDALRNPEDVAGLLLSGRSGHRSRNRRRTPAARVHCQLNMS